MVMSNRTTLTVTAEGEVRQSDPYNFHSSVQYQAVPVGSDEPVVSQWSDHLVSRYQERYNELARKFFGNEGHYWDQREGKTIEAFLREILELPSLHLTRVTMHPSANGYPVWQFHFQLFKEGRS